MRRRPMAATALHWAVHFDDVNMVQMLIGAGANVKATNRFGVTPLALACQNGNAAIVEKVIKAGADPNAALSELGDTPLMMAARTGNVGTVRVLLDNGANVNAKENSRSQTALMWAASEGHPAAAKLLIERGADVNARSKIVAAAARGGGGGGGAGAGARGRKSRCRNARSNGAGRWARRCWASSSSAGACGSGCRTSSSRTRPWARASSGCCCAAPTTHTGNGHGGVTSLMLAAEGRQAGCRKDSRRCQGRREYVVRQRQYRDADGDPQRQLSGRGVSFGSWRQPEPRRQRRQSGAVCDGRNAESRHNGYTGTHCG